MHKVSFSVSTSKSLGWSLSRCSLVLSRSWSRLVLFGLQHDLQQTEAETEWEWEWEWEWMEAE